MTTLITTETAPAPLTDGVRAAISNSTSANTRRAYRAAMQAFLNAGYALPASDKDVADYLVSMASAGKKMATIRLACAALSAGHRALGFENPSQSEIVKLALRGLARTIGKPQTQASALTAPALAAIKATACLPRRGRSGAKESDGAARRRGLLDIALTTLLSDAGLRRSEASALTWDDVTEWTDGSGRVQIARSKTDTTGAGAWVAITAQCLSDLLAIKPKGASGALPVFALSDSQIHRRVKQAAKSAGLGDGFGGHSGRIGMARRMSGSGASTDTTMRQGRWKSPHMVARYTALESAGAALKYL